MLRMLEFVVHSDTQSLGGSKREPFLNWCLFGLVPRDTRFTIFLSIIYIRKNFISTCFCCNMLFLQTYRYTTFKPMYTLISDEHLQLLVKLLGDSLLHEKKNMPYNFDRLSTYQIKQKTDYALDEQPQSKGLKMKCKTCHLIKNNLFIHIATN